jgi:glutamate transport system substrate-binding protein
MVSPSSQNSQTAQRKSPKKTISILLAITLVLLIGVVAYFITSKDHPKPTPNNPKKESVLNVGIQITDSPGFSELNDGQRSGFDVDVANYITNRMGKHANFVPITVSSRDQQLKEGFVDMVVSTYSITDAHIQNGIIFAGPYIRTDQGLMVTKDTTGIDSVEDLENKTVCVTTGSTTALKLEAFKQSVPLVITYRDTLAQCIDDMKSGTDNIAAVTSDAVILQGYAHSDDTLHYLSGLTIPGAYEKYGIGVSKKNPELCKKAAALLKDFVSTQWNSAFTANLQTDSSQAKSLKPDLNSIDSESCKTN